MEVNITTDVTAANEPLLIALSSEKWINQFLQYPTTGGDTEELAMINEMAKAARELCEKETNLSFAEKTITVFWELDELKRKDYKMPLPYGPISSISNVYIVYADGTDDYELEANTDYYLFGEQHKDIWMAEVIGTAGTGEIAGHKVVYTAGFGADTCEALPKALKVIMARQVAMWYSKRQEYIPVLDAEIKKALNLFTRKTWI